MKKKDRFIWVAIVVISVVAIGFSVYQRQQVEDLLKLDQTYVVGKVVEKRTPTRGSPIIVFTYIFNNQKHKREVNGEYRIKEGERYFVSIPEGHQDQGIILFDKPVPDHITATPEGGWEELPVE